MHMFPGPFLGLGGQTSCSDDFDDVELRSHRTP